MLKFFVLLLTVGVTWAFPRHFTPLQMSRIVGGHAANIRDYPYQLALYTETRDYLYFCGAALIGSQWALTAAHCIHKEYDAMHVRAGSSFKYSGGQDIAVSKVVVHPSYGDREKFNYDFALLKLANEVTTDNADPISLPSSNYQVKTGAEAIISGWGALAHNEATNVLQATKIPIVDHEYCSQRFGSQFTDAMFCAGMLAEGGIDTCQGDSGGPVVIDGVLAGIVSWGYDCGAPYLPGVYADVAHVTEWVNQQISQSRGLTNSEEQDISLESTYDSDSDSDSDSESDSDSDSGYDFDDDYYSDEDFSF